MSRCKNHEKITVDENVVGFTANQYTGLHIVEVLVTVEGGSGIRITFDGTDPDPATNTGHIIPDGASISVEGEVDIARTKFVSEDGTDVFLNCSYFQG